MVLDEPTAGQDTDNVLRLMDDLTRPGQFDALVFATHDLELVRAYANRVVVMSTGQIVADGAPEIAWESAAVGIFGVVCAREFVFADGDRIEIYRPLAVDPRAARRERAAGAKRRGRASG